MAAHAASVNMSDVRRVVSRLGQAGAQARMIVAGALWAEANAIAKKIQKEIPVDTGTLRSTLHVSMPQFQGPRIVVTIGVGGPAAKYAAAVHENPRAGKTGGIGPSGQKYKHWAKVGNWKYMEDPFTRAKPGIPDRLAERISRRLKAVK